MISFLFTNLKHVQVDYHSNAKVFLGNYQCPIIGDEGYTIYFTVPKDMPYGRYSLRVERKGLVAQTPDSVFVLKGIWSYPEKPVFPEGANTGPNALGFYGTCFSANKGYIVSGIYKNHLPVFNSSIDINYPNYILEFDGPTAMWTKRFTTNHKSFEEPRCYLYNNTIYVIGGREAIDSGIWPVKNMWKLDLSSMTWTRGEEVPHKNIANPISFELNGEWFIGSGVDITDLNLCCGYPIPTPKMWKYSPSQNTWTPVADFPGRYQKNPTTFTIGDKAYVFSGAIHKGSHDNQYETEFERELWEYTPASNTWTQIPLPEVDSHLILPIGEKYCIFSYNGKAYFLSSQKMIATGLGYQFSTFASFTEFDPQAKTFTKISYPSNYPPMKMFFKNGNKFYFQSDALGDRAEFNETYELLID